MSHILLLLRSYPSRGRWAVLLLDSTPQRSKSFFVNPYFPRNHSSRNPLVTYIFCPWIISIGQFFRQKIIWIHLLSFFLPPFDVPRHHCVQIQNGMPSSAHKSQTRLKPASTFSKLPDAPWVSFRNACMLCASRPFLPFQCYPRWSLYRLGMSEDGYA